MQSHQASAGANTGAKVKKFMQALFGSTNVSLYDVAGQQVVAAKELDGSAVAERQRASKGKAAASEEDCDELSDAECVSHMRVDIGEGQDAAYYQQQYRQFKHFEREHKRKQQQQEAEATAAAAAGDSLVRRATAIARGVLSTATLEQAVDRVYSTAAEPAEAAAAAADFGSPTAPSQRSSYSHRSSLSSGSAVEMELACMPSSGASACDTGAGSSSRSSRSGSWVEGPPGPSGHSREAVAPGPSSSSHSRAAAWVQDLESGCGGSGAAWAVDCAGPSGGGSGSGSGSGMVPVSRYGIIHA